MQASSSTLKTFLGKAEVGSSAGGRGSPGRAIVRYRRPPQAKGRIGDRARRVGGFWPVIGFKALCPSFLFCHGAGNARLSSGQSGREGIFTRGHGLLRQGKKGSSASKGREQRGVRTACGEWYSPLGVTGPLVK